MQQDWRLAGGLEREAPALLGLEVPEHARGAKIKPRSAGRGRLGAFEDLPVKLVGVGHGHGREPHLEDQGKHGDQAPAQAAAPEPAEQADPAGPEGQPLPVQGRFGQGQQGAQEEGHGQGDHQERWKIPEPIPNEDIKMDTILREISSQGRVLDQEVQD